MKMSLLLSLTPLELQPSMKTFHFKLDDLDHLKKTWNKYNHNLMSVTHKGSEHHLLSSPWNGSDSGPTWWLPDHNIAGVCR
jgi:hypothetical protein